MQTNQIEVLWTENQTNETMSLASNNHHTYRNNDSMINDHEFLNICFKWLI